MRITEIEGLIHSSAFTYGNPAGVGGNLHLRSMDTLLVRVTTEDGRTGWGEGFGFTLAPTTRHALQALVAPAALGADAADIAGTLGGLARRFHNFGRNGPVTFALSGLEIALWDLAGQRAGRPVAGLLGGARRARVPAYASLLRYGEPGLVARAVAAALARGFRRIKLHEVDLACIRAARAAAPEDVPIMLDINCAFTGVPEAIAFCRAVAGLPNIAWVEEPVWPPEDFAAIAAVRRAGGVPIAAGENLGDPLSVGAMIAAGAVDVVQPSVTKLGGISALREVAGMAARAGVAMVPHCPYFGPGLLASLHVLAAAEVAQPLEYYFADLAAPPLPELIPAAGWVAVPEGAGLGLVPRR